MFETGGEEGNQSGYFRAGELGQEASEFYQEYGYLVVTDGWSKQEIKELKDEAVAICRQERGELERSFQNASSEAEFPTAAELKAMDGDEAIKHFLCIHQPHKTSPIIYRHLSHPVIVEALTRVIGPNVKCMQSMLFIKTAGKPGQAWHQDEDYIPTRDRSLTGAWIALDQATVQNGCLWVIPGSHKAGVLWPQYPHNDDRYDCAEMSYDFPYTDKDAVPVEVPAGSVVFFNGYLLHKSEPNNTSDQFRRSLVNHYMSAESLLPWYHQDNLQGRVANTDFRDVVLIAGEDPYSWAGTKDIVRPYVRAAGEGGCGDGRVDLKSFKQQAT